MKRPSFQFPMCNHCGSTVEKMTIERLEDGAYRVTVFCHDRRLLLRVSLEELDERGGEPLVMIPNAFVPRKED